LVNKYSTFKVLIDEPTSDPGLGFEYYASALADVIRASKPQFAVGIFGGWGSGKTTLMQAIRQGLDQDERVATVWFNAWRYEQESHLIVPLLDVVQEALQARSATTSGEQHDRWKRLAGSVSRAAKAILRGTTLTTSVLGFGVELDLGGIAEGYKTDDLNDTGPATVSLYHGAFTLLRTAMREFAAHGQGRIVVFVDDLDRCMPHNALSVLESMKLFFDLEGFIFVVGLDRAIIERAVSLKYGLEPTPGGPTISGSEYLKKVFQVPFTLPRIAAAQLSGYLDRTVVNGNLSQDQQEDFDSNVRRHLQYVSGAETINPREIKRLINAYTMQVKMLSARLGAAFEPNVAITIQCMSFRPDWEELYDALIIDPALFQQEVRAALHEPVRDVIWIASKRISLPLEFIGYVSTIAHPLLDVMDLGAYVSAAEAGRNTDPRLLEGHAIVSRVRQELEATLQEIDENEYIRLQHAGPGSARLTATAAVGYRSNFTALERAFGGEGRPGRSGLADAFKRFNILTQQPPEAKENLSYDSYRDRLVQWVSEAGKALDAIDNELRELRHQASIGARASI
jgi:hypothetical protein